VIKELLHQYYADTLAALVPEQLTWALTDAVERNLQLGQSPAFSDGDGDGFTTLAAATLRATSTRNAISTTLSPESLVRQSSDGGIRLEVLGLICAISARSMVSNTACQDQARGLKGKMLKQASFCLATAREVSPLPNDMSLWFRYENLKLVIAAQGMHGVSPTRGARAWNAS
jgi:hypothetical protein